MRDIKTFSVPHFVKLEDRTSDRQALTGDELILMGCSHGGIAIDVGHRNREVKLVH